MTHHKSSMNAKWKPTQVMVQGMLGFGGALFWIFANLEPDRPVMPVEVYGDAVRLFEAETWAQAIFYSSAIFLFGIYRNGRSWYSPHCRALGAFGHSCVYAMFIYYARTAPFGDPVVILTSCLLLPTHLFFLGLNLLDIFARKDSLHVGNG